MPERVRVREEDATDEERRQRRLQDPEVRKRLQEIRESIARGEQSPGSPRRSCQSSCVSMLEGFLMDLIADPFSKGKEDGDSGVWTGWAGPFILVTYVLERDTRRIHVADISYA